jgi:hypothetical protein
MTAIRSRQVKGPGSASRPDHGLSVSDVWRRLQSVYEHDLDGKAKTRYNCAAVVLILRGVAQGVPAEHLARELGVDRAHLLEHRHAIQKLIERHIFPLRS